MKQQIKIEKIIEKVSKTNNKYLSLMTDAGAMSCFDPFVMNKIKSESLDKTFEVEVEQKNGFHTIVNIYDILSTPVIRPASDNYFTDKQETISCQWAIKSAIEALKLNNIQVIDRDKLLSDIKEMAIKLKEMSKNLK